MPAQNFSAQSRLMGAVAYLFFFVSGVILLYLEPFDRDPFVRFHARQSIGFSIAVLAINFVISILVALMPRVIGGAIGFLLDLINLALFALWIFLMYKAYIGEQYRIPELADVVDSVAGAG